MLAPDEVRAWSWYDKGAAAGEPQSLVRTAERFDDAALSAGDDATCREKLLAAFVRYADAADRAAAADRPDDLWRGWRYRRASVYERAFRGTVAAALLMLLRPPGKVVAWKTLLTSMQS